MDSRVTAMATPSRSTISPTIWAPNSELPRASGIRDESATGCAPLALAGGPATGDGVDDGLIWGNRLEALPPGMVVDTPATAGSGPTGMLVPSPREPDRPEMVAVDPSPAGVVVEPLPLPADGDLDAVGLELDDAAALVTVTVWAADLVALDPPLFAVRMTLNLNVSAGALFGTVTCTSACGVVGLLAGRLSEQVVLEQEPAVKAGVSAGDFALGTTVMTIDPSSFRLLQAAIRNSTVPPAWTLVAEAVTVTSAAGVAGGLVLPEPVGVGVGVGVEVGGSVALTELPPEPELLEEPVLLGVGVGVGVALVVGPLALGELDAWVADALLEAAEVAAADEAADEAVDELEELAERADGDGLADADGETEAMAVPVTPLVITNRPVARPTVTGRECADRMRTPCLWLLSRLENVPFRTLCRSERSGWLLIVYVPIRHQNRCLMPPLPHT